MTRPATPFDSLLGVTLGRTPKTVGRSQLVVAGRCVKTAGEIKDPDEVEATDAEELRRELRRARNRARYQLDRQNPEAMAKRKAWFEKNQEKVRAYQEQYREANKDRINECRANWAKRDYYADPVKHRQKQRDYYQRNREQILAKLQEKRDAAKAAKAAAKLK